MSSSTQSNSPAHLAATVLAERAPGFRPRIGLILGSGLGPLADNLKDSIAIPYEELPGFRPSTVVGHKGALVLGYHRGVAVACMTGRSHFYEGIEWPTLTTPIRTMRLLGAEILLATNASGSLHPDLEPGSVVSLSDHINFQGSNPLIGPNDDRFGPRFVSMHEVYDLELRELMRTAADDVGTPLRDGVYVAVAGPMFETKAEVKAFRTLGGDIVGMSTVPEGITALHCGMRVAAVSVVTNFAAQGESHELTLKTSQQTIPLVQPLVERWIELVGTKVPSA